MKENLLTVLLLPVYALLAVGWVGSIPLAIIYGDKLDVALSFIIPFYGAIVALMEVL
jgi:hypothetical protein